MKGHLERHVFYYAASSSKTNVDRVKDGQLVLTTSSMNNTLLVLLLLLMKYVKSLELSDFTVNDGAGDAWSFSKVKHVPVRGCGLDHGAGD